MDRALTEALNGLLVHHDALEDPIAVYEHLGEVLFIVVLLALVVLGGSSLRRGAVAAGAAAVTAGTGVVPPRLVAAADWTGITERAAAFVTAMG